MLQALFRKKEIQNQSTSELHRVLNGFDLTLLGIGAIIGAGVFVLTGIAAATKAGPGVTLSFMLAGAASMFAAFAYAELASSIGGTGSAYSYAYAGFGEFIAWLIGWNLLLEYSLSVATVAIGWSGYVNNLFQAFHVHIPTYLTTDFFEGGFVNVLAMSIIVFLAIVLCIGMKTSARFNSIIVVIKLTTITLFIAIASFHIDTRNWQPFLPFGWSGVVSGASLVFFAYIGFDALSTAVEETKQPEKNVPIGIISSLSLCTFIYIIVSALLTGMAHYTTLNVNSPVAFALLEVGHHFASGLIAAGAIAGLTSVILVMFYGLTRIFLAMAIDGLLPNRIAHIHPQTRTPIIIIITTGILIAIIAGISPIERLAELVNIGTLAAFTFVCAGIIILRKTHPDLPRAFKSPFTPLFPLLGILSCSYLMISLPSVTWFRFGIWTLIGVVIYFCYGIHHSALRIGKKKKIT